MSRSSDKSFFVTGIGTNVGKTVISAVLCQALEADYWKPVQAGNLQNSDADMVKKFCGNRVKIYDEAYVLKNAISPHAAAHKEGAYITLKNIKKPTSSKILIIEGAGGILVPLNKKQTNLDLMKKLGSPVILVVKNYLGSINHTLLSLSVLKSHKIPVVGIMISGERNEQSEVMYQHRGKTKILSHVPKFTRLSKSVVAEFADTIRRPLKQSLRDFL